MMTTRKIFEGLYNGDFSVFERKVPRTTENKALHKKINDEERYFVQKMSIDDCQRFQKLQDLYMESSSYEQEDAFAYGFRFATMIMSAVFVGGGEPVSKVK
ncbi:MAG: hypothetical protein FWF81_01970 [Defluviitaleaceae bacterium]|nr:hypothetical protein [Defluviitaleaceae bacterium]